MKKNLIQPNTLLIIGIIMLVALMRIIPHYPNFTPIAAIALFGGASFKKKWLAFLVPISALILSDLLIGFHKHIFPVYLSFLLIACLGFLIKRIKARTIFFTSVAASTLFFLITNFGVWVGSPFYPQNIAGLISCYTAAIPFYFSGLMGDLFYSGLLFGSFYFLQQKVPVFQLQAVDHAKRK